MQRRDMTIQASGLMITLCFIWALAQVVLKYTAADMAATLQIALRSLGGAVLTWCFVRWRGVPLFTLSGAWKPGLWVGVLFASEFFFVGEALRYTTASHVSIFLYTAPIFAALGLHFLSADERLQPAQWFGVGLAFIGIIISFLGREVTNQVVSSPNMLLGDGLALMAGVLWGATTVVVRGTKLKEAPATETLFYQLMGAFVLLAFGAVVTGQTAINWSVSLILSLAFQTILVSFVSLLTWFWLLKKFLASRLGVLSFMTPLFGVILGVVLLNEQIERSFVIGAFCVLSGIVLVSGYDWLFKRAQLPLIVDADLNKQDSSHHGRQIR